MNETAAWHSAYDSETQVQRRRSQIPIKLRKLGLAEASRESHILDLCCGNGETLDALYSMGFRHLVGVDVSTSPNLLADRRFEIYEGDACAVPFPDESIDWVLIVHALHHMESASRVESLVAECHRILKPGGKLAIIDFPNSWQIRFAFWFFRQRWWLVTAYLKYFGSLVQEEWHFLKGYLAEWPKVRQILHNDRFIQEHLRQELFYYYLTLRKR